MSHWTDGEKNCSEGVDGEWCLACITAWQRDYSYWKAQWDAATDAERDPEKYRESMIDAGRGHLVKGDHNVR